MFITVIIVWICLPVGVYAYIELVMRSKVLTFMLFIFFDQFRLWMASTFVVMRYVISYDCGWRARSRERTLERTLRLRIEDFDGYIFLLLIIRRIVRMIRWWFVGSCWCCWRVTATSTAPSSGSWMKTWQLVQLVTFNILFHQRFSSSHGSTMQCIFLVMKFYYNLDATVFHENSWTKSGKQTIFPVRKLNDT